MPLKSLLSNPTGFFCCGAGADAAAPPPPGLQASGGAKCPTAAGPRKLPPMVGAMLGSNAARQLPLDKRPLTQLEEQWLATASNCCTMTLFKPLDNWKKASAKSNDLGVSRIHYLFQGLPRQCAFKALDDSIFMSNVQRVSETMEQSFDIKDPIKDPRKKALVGVVSRILTLGVMVPVNALQARGASATAALSKSSGATKGGVVTVQMPPPYAGFARQALKESVFTAAYILSGPCIAKKLEPHRHWVQDQLTCACPRLRDNEAETRRMTDIALAAVKNAIGGAMSNALSQPIDMYGKGIAPNKQLTSIARKSARKASYNLINTVILQNLQHSKRHRRLLEALLPAPPAAVDDKFDASGKKSA